MATYRCSLCAINYPGEQKMFGPMYPRCVVCNEPTSFFYDQASDPDWQEKVKGLLEDRKDEELGELLPIAEARVRVEGGQLWVLAWDVWKETGERRLCYGDLFRIGKQTFEVLKYVEDRREYLVRAFSMTVSDEDLASAGASRG